MRRSYSHGVKTCGNCCVEGCTNCACGGGKCVDHLEADIAEILGDEILANKIHEGIRKVWTDVSSALVIIENTDSCNGGF